MSLRLDGLLKDVEIARLDAHLASCPACAARWQAMQRASTLLEAAPLALPTAGFAERVMHRVAMLPARQASWPLVVRPRVAMAAGLVALVALVALAWAVVISLIGQPASIGEIGIAGLKTLTTLAATVAGMWRVGSRVAEMAFSTPSRLFLLTDCLLGLLLGTLLVRLIRPPAAERLQAE
jgi:anti-sigma factor RsiW